MLQTFMSLQRFMLLIQCIFFPGSYSKFGTISDELTNFQFFFFLILIGYLNASVQCKPTLLQFNTMNVLVINSLNLPQHHLAHQIIRGMGDTTTKRAHE